MTSSSWPAVLYGSLVISTSPGCDSSTGYSSSMFDAPIASELMWPGVPVTACATIRPATIEHGVGEVACLAHDRAEGGPLQRAGLLVDRRDQALPEDLELDRVEPARSRASDRGLSVTVIARAARVWVPSSHASVRSRSSCRRVATSTCQPGRTTTVVSRSSTIAGPSNVSPAPSADLSYTGTGSAGCPASEHHRAAELGLAPLPSAAGVGSKSGADDTAEIRHVTTWSPTSGIVSP